MITQSPLRILITNNTLDQRSGSELFVRDLALSFMQRGHYPIAYSTVLGDVADELRRASIPVIDDLAALVTPPDIIHGQHHLDAMTAMLRFPHVPAILACHGWAPWEELPPVFPSIRRYVAVDDLCRERLLTTPGIPEERVEVLYNFVDLERFKLRTPLPEKPQSALIFSNYASDDNFAFRIRQACSGFGIKKIDIVGISSGNRLAAPEDILGNYDIVFAKARCALEAMASGCAVVVADYAGMGGLVTTDNMEYMRRFNFGLRTMQNGPIDEKSVQSQLSRYDSRDSRKVTEWVRIQADMSLSIDRWLEIYNSVLSEEQGALKKDRQELELASLLAASVYLHSLAPVIKGRYEASAAAQQAREALAHKETELSAKVAELNAKEAELNAKVAELNAKNSELTSIYRSGSWKVVKLCRKLKSWIRFRKSGNCTQ